MADHEQTAELGEAIKKIDMLEKKLNMLENELRIKSIPKTQLLDQSFLKRAFAVLGHNTVASLIIMIPFYILMFVAVFLIGFGFRQ